VLHLILGGAAVHRCVNRAILNKALAAEGLAFAQKRLFLQALKLYFQQLPRNIYETSAKRRHTYAFARAIPGVRRRHPRPTPARQIERAGVFVSEASWSVVLCSLIEERTIYSSLRRKNC
jgi:hypothetical protein